MTQEAEEGMKVSWGMLRIHPKLKANKEKRDPDNSNAKGTPNTIV
jgi:hypothetical protein